jgi:site-specific recombinase XerD
MSQAPTSNTQSTAGVADLDALGESFARHLRATRHSPKTVVSYLSAIDLLDAYLADRGMPRAAASIRREHIESFLEDQQARLKPASAANRYRSLVQFWKWLVKVDEIPTSPMDNIDPPKVPDTPVPVFTGEALALLLKACSGKDFDSRRDKAIISLLIDSGIRRAELAGLRVSDIEFPTGRRRDSSIGGFATVIGKGDIKRTVAFDVATSADLDDYLRARARHPRAREEWLWLGLKGRLSDSGIAQALRRRSEAAGLGARYLHLFRHTFAHQWLADGGSEGDLMMLMGWKSRTMLQRYARSTATERALAAHARHSPRNKVGG